MVSLLAYGNYINMCIKLPLQIDYLFTHANYLGSKSRHNFYLTLLIYPYAICQPQ